MEEIIYLNYLRFNVIWDEFISHLFIVANSKNANFRNLSLNNNF